MNLKYTKIFLLAGIVACVGSSVFAEPLRLNSTYNNEPWACYYKEASCGYQTLKYGGIRAKGDCKFFINNDRIVSDIKSGMCRGETKAVKQSYDGATYFCTYFKQGPDGGYILMPKNNYRYREVKNAGAITDDRVIADIKNGNCKIIEGKPNSSIWKRIFHK